MSLSIFEIKKVYNIMLALKLTPAELSASKDAVDALFEKVALGTKFTTLWKIIVTVSLK
jgi:hypothetical protein